MTRTRTGVWFVGARGDVAATAIAGARGIVRGTTDDTGTITPREPRTGIDVSEIGGVVFADHDTVERPLSHAATDRSDSDVTDRTEAER